MFIFKSEESLQMIQMEQGQALIVDQGKIETDYIHNADWSRKN